ncbi:MAG TPA: methyltransferase domain-containing protein [Burkholderiaceae bacterium]|nr:methyltransferase domain-containing protein [Burkholderiaceae bacterium]
MAAAIVGTLLAGPACAQTASPPAVEPYSPMVGQSGKDVVWVPTSQTLVDKMLDMAQLTPQDRLVDLGSGDGRLAITAAKRGAQARGIEFNPDMVELARRQARAEGVADRATFEEADIFESDFSEATVVTLFLLPTLNLKLRPVLLDMPAGTRIVANSFDMGDWKPDETADVTDDCLSHCTALKWTVPAKVAGNWQMDGKTLELTQNFQMLEGSLSEGSSTRPIADGRLDGARIRFSIGDDRYLGEVDDGTMRGTVNGSGRWTAKRALP